MPDTPPATDRAARRLPRRAALLTVAGALVLVAAILLVTGLARQEPAPPARPDTAAAPPTTAAPAQPSGTPSAPKPSAPEPVLPASRPTRLTIASLGVSSSLERLGLDDHDVMETPRDPDKAGWYERGSTPGARGPAVIAGHVTWNGHKAVFFDLARLRPGQRIDVDRADGTRAAFTVTRTDQYPKDHFPSLEVYGNTDHAELRLITCGGAYSDADHHYSDNVVVYARLTSKST
ncbi:class F sortase [Streptomyces sp. NPDC048182]|uniref:class F sortase n=1 Tax=Streptomyces sp. NPDC048182 TaxID=3365507 RepID=UPI00371EFD5F